MANEATKAMIKQLQARLIDLKEVVKEADFELEGYDARLDKIDDQVYDIQAEIEAAIKNGSSAQTGSEVRKEAISESVDGGDGSAPSVSEVGADAQAGSEAAPAEGEQAAAKEHHESSDTKIGNFTITADMKDSMRQGAEVVGDVVRDGREIVGELTDTMNDVRDALGFGAKTPRRRR